MPHIIGAGLDGLIKTVFLAFAHVTHCRTNQLCFTREKSLLDLMGYERFICFSKPYVHNVLIWQ
jgi:hypothetical protein